MCLESLKCYNVLKMFDYLFELLNIKDFFKNFLFVIELKLIENYFLV